MSDTAGVDSIINREAVPEEARDEPLIELEDITMNFTVGTSFNPFKEQDQVNAVNDISFSMDDEDVLVLVGESGSGKTTLGKIATALQRPSEGSVKYRGQDVWDAKDGRGQITIEHRHIREGLQIIHQDPVEALNPNRTILSTLEQPLTSRSDIDIGPGGRRERIYNVLEEVNLTPAADYASRYPHQLSGGEKQRVVLSRALLMDPEMVLADEPVSALDVSLRVEIMDLMLDLRDAFEIGYIMVSHNLSNARYFAEHADGKIGIMYLGELVEIGDPEEVIYNPQHPYTRVLKWATPSLDPGEVDKGSPPLREIDIPDARDPPSGCRFHTRCPYARETCETETPVLEDDAVEGHEVACFRQYEAHEYWQSELLSEEAAQRADEYTEREVERSG